MTDTSELLAEKSGTPPETALTDSRHGLLRRRTVVTGWTIRPYVRAVEKELGYVKIDDSWSKEQIREWREAYDREEEKPAKWGLFLSEAGSFWWIDRDGLLWPPHD